MGLTRDQEKWLRARYATWGLERVREELARDDRDLIAHPDVTEFARAWVEGEEARRRRAKHSMAILAVVVLAQIAIAFALLLPD